MKVDTIKGACYVLTCTAACSVRAIRPDGGEMLLVVEAEKAGQFGFVAPTDAVEVSDEDALVTQTFKMAPVGLSASRGSGLSQEECDARYGRIGTSNIWGGHQIMAQALTVEGRSSFKGSMYLDSDLTLYGADGEPGGGLRGWYGSPYKSTIIIKDAGEREYMGISYNAEISQASLDLRGDAGYFALPEKLVGPVQFYEPDRNYMLLGMMDEYPSGYCVRTDFRFFANGGMIVSLGAVFHGGVTMDESLNVAGKTVLNTLEILGGQYSVFTVETARATWTNTQAGYFRLQADKAGEQEVILELGEGKVDSRACLIKPGQSGPLTERDVPNCQEGDARWVKFNNTLTDAEYAALAVKDQTTLYITSDGGKVYLGSYALN